MSQVELPHLNEKKSSFPCKITVCSFEGKMHVAKINTIIFLESYILIWGTNRYNTIWKKRENKGERMKVRRQQRDIYRDGGFVLLSKKACQH